MSANYIIEGGKKLRCGFTTGAAAAGAAKAAASTLFSGKKSSSVTIETLEGTVLELQLESVTIQENQVVCGIKKDAGDDPDITNNIVIYASVRENPRGDIVISGGEGVGVVTKKGLACEVGEAAINPGPRKMIDLEVKKVLPPGQGVFVTIFAPEGKELAGKTLNPDLGITGGISILGTTGIVRPMSEEAFRESLAIKISVMREEGKKSALFVPGNYGKDFAVNALGLEQDRIVIMSNFVGYMLDQASYYGLKNILLVGHPGKLIKVAGGIFHTHSKTADARFEILAALYISKFNDLKTARRILTSNSIDEAVCYIENSDFFDYAALKIKERCEKRTGGTINIQSVLFSLKKEMLGCSPGARELIEALKEEKN